MSENTANINIQSMPSQHGHRKTVVCPECGAQLTGDSKYVAWCSHCDWNLDPVSQSEEEAKSAFEKIYDSLGKNQSKYIFEKVSNPDSLKPTWSLSKIIAYIVATFIHLITILFLAGGLWLVILGTDFFLRAMDIVFGLFLLLIAYHLRPRFLKIKMPYAERGSFAALYNLSDQISAALNTKPVDGIIVTKDYNAAFSRIGLKREKVLFIGYPIWSVLTNKERIALIGHEIAHDTNGDSTKGLYIGSAIHSLFRWYQIIYPDHIFDSTSLIGLLLIPVHIARWGLAKLIYYFAYALTLLLWRDAQKAEYWADYESTVVSGTPAMLGVLQKFHFSDTFQLTVRNVALNWHNEQKDLFVELKKRIDEVPEKEMERRRRIDLKNLSRLEVTHPPTAYRVEFLEANPVITPQIRVEDIDFEAINRELNILREEIAIDLMKRHAPAYFYSFTDKSGE